MNTENITTLPETGFVRQSQLVPRKQGGVMVPGIIPFSAATLWRKVRSKEFPAPVKLSENVTAWRVEEIRAWIAARN